MRGKRTIGSVMAWMWMFWLGTVLVASAGELRKKPDPTQMHTPESSSQITLGGAEYFVEGELLKIEGQHYLVKKDQTGEQVRLVVNQDTNLDCADAPASRSSGSARSEAVTHERVPEAKQAPQASEQQIARGQRKDETAMGSGFRIGQCALQPGDRIRAEVDDMGRVTTLKFLGGLPPASARATGPSAGTGELAIPGRQEKLGQLDLTGPGGAIPQQYAVLPVPLGQFESSGSDALHHKPIKNLQGKEVGTLEELIMDTTTGRVEYAVIDVAGTAHHLHPVPWAAIKLQSKDGALAPVIDTNQYDIRPGITMKDAKDLSPEIEQIVKNMQTLREQEPSKAEKRVHARPAAGGEMGEDEAARGGMSGPRGMPSASSPGFEGAQSR